MVVESDSYELTAKSRFSDKIYQDVLKSCFPRYKLKDQEQILWKGRNFYASFFGVLFISWLVSAMIILLYGLFHNNSPEYESFLTVFFISSFAVIIASLIIVGVLYHRNRYSFLKKRILLNTIEFADRSLQLDKSRIDIIKAVRDTMGVIYHLDPALIYPEDTAYVLELMSNRNSPPYQFELVLGTAYRLGIALPDKEVDDIGRSLSENARNVEVLILTMCREIAVVEKKQQKSLTGESTGEISSSLNTNVAVHQPKLKILKQKLIIPACFG